MARILPWAAADAAAMSRAFAVEADRWTRHLAWDTRELWPAVERARQAGRLEGVVVDDGAGGIAGWAYFACRDGDLQIGAVAAGAPADTAALIDAVLASPHAADARRAVVFAFSEAPALGEVLSSRGFLHDGYAYLVRPVGPSAPPSVPGRAWDLRDLDSTADLLRASYPPEDALRPFAPQGRPAEWRQYVGDLVMGQGCGRFRASLSVALPGDDGRLDAVALVTDIGERSAHLAQLAVRPGLRGAGLGAALLTAVEGQCAASGYERLTLLVGDGNRRASRLYRRAGYLEQARFVCAARGRLRERAAVAVAGARARG